MAADRSTRQTRLPLTRPDAWHPCQGHFLGRPERPTQQDLIIGVSQMRHGAWDFVTGWSTSSCHFVTLSPTCHPGCPFFPSQVLLCSCSLQYSLAYCGPPPTGTRGVRGTRGTNAKCLVAKHDVPKPFAHGTDTRGMLTPALGLLVLGTPLLRPCTVRINDGSWAVHAHRSWGACSCLNEAG